MKEQAAAYMKNGGTHCLYCGSPKIEGQGLDPNDGYPFEEVICLDCGKQWVDYYEIVAVDVTNDDETNTTYRKEEQDAEL